MKVQANTIRPGNVIEHEDRRWIVINYELITPGKGNAFIAIEMRDATTGTKTNARFRTADSVERLLTDSRECQFLFADGENLTFMDNVQKAALIDGNVMGRLPAEFGGKLRPLMLHFVTVVPFPQNDFGVGLAGRHHRGCRQRGRGYRCRL